jgi:DNA-directed RNA polymerase II subunit RPB2
MVQSKHCILHGLPRDARFQLGECRNDLGGYFIIDGKEKCIVPQEKFADNMLYMRRGKRRGDAPDHGDLVPPGEDDDQIDDFLYSTEIRSVSENVAKPVRTLSVRMMAPTASLRNRQIVVNVPNVRKPVPLFILFRALGVISDRDIIRTCLLDMEDKYADLVDLFIPSVHDSGGIFNQNDALHYVGSLTKGKTPTHALAVLADYFLPHMGELNFRAKALFLGMMVFRLLSVHAGIERPTDRDNFKYKRVELSGALIGDLFREYYRIQLKDVHLAFDRETNLRQGAYENGGELLSDLVRDKYHEFFREHRQVDDGFRKAFKGNWGSVAHTKRVGVVQDLNRLSFNTMISHLRKINLPMDAGLKIVEPRLLHPSQWGYIDPIDTPDGGNIGFHKNLAIACAVTRGYSREPMVAWLRTELAMRMLEDGVASADDIDHAMVTAYRHPIGPLRLSDIVGLDVRLDIARHFISCPICCCAKRLICCSLNLFLHSRAN